MGDDYSPDHHGILDRPLAGAFLQSAGQTREQARNDS
jgi:hypothetical protein